MGGRRGVRAIMAVAAISVACALLRLLSINGTATETALSELVSRDGVAESLLMLEMSPQGFGEAFAMGFLTLPEDAPPPSQLPEDTPETPPPEPSEAPEAAREPPVEPALTNTPSPPPDEEEDSGRLYYTGVEIAPSGELDNRTPLLPDGITLHNTSGLDVDIGALMSEPLETNLASDGPQVLIIHTHGSEAFTQAPGEEYEESDPYRTQEREKSILYVGDVLSEELASRGIEVIHDSGVYDYPSYAGAYGRALEAIKGYLEEYPSISLVIDLHRDAQESSVGGQYKTVAEFGDTRCAQIMLVVGTDAAGLTHPGWHDNMKLALRLEHEMNDRYPTLARPVGIREYRYNQHLTKGSLIVEVGAAGNTLTDAVTAVRHFADVYADVITAGLE